MRLRIASAALIALMGASMIVAQAALTTGSRLNGTLTQGYNSKSAYVGQAVKLVNVTSDDGSGSVIGGTLYGTVTSVQKASQGRPGKIAFAFTSLVLRNGTSYAVSSTVTKMQANTKSNALKEAGGALAGMLVGNAIMKTVFQASGGGIIGAAGGFLLAKNNRQDIDVSQGSIVQVQLNSVTRRQSR